MVSAPRLLAALRHATAQDTRVLLLRGGQPFANGIHLGVIDAAPEPAAACVGGADGAAEGLEQFPAGACELAVRRVGRRTGGATLGVTRTREHGYSDLPGGLLQGISTAQVQPPGADLGLAGTAT